MCVCVCVSAFLEVWHPHGSSSLQHTSGCISSRAVGVLMFFMCEDVCVCVCMFVCVCVCVCVFE